MSNIQLTPIDPVFRFKDLPAEVQLDVYSRLASPNCVVDTEKLEVLDFADDGWSFSFPLDDACLPTFALTNKAICHDYLMTCFKERTFRVGITVDMVDFQTKVDLGHDATAWLGKLEASSFAEQCRFHHISIRVHESEGSYEGATINATINVDYVAKSDLKYHTSLRFDDTVFTPWDEGRIMIQEPYDLLCEKLKSFAESNGAEKPGLTWPQLQILLSCIEVAWHGMDVTDEGTLSLIETWKRSVAVDETCWASGESDAMGFEEGDTWKPEEEAVDSDEADVVAEEFRIEQPSEAVQEVEKAII